MARGDNTLDQPCVQPLFDESLRRWELADSLAAGVRRTNVEYIPVALADRVFE